MLLVSKKPVQRLLAFIVVLTLLFSLLPPTLATATTVEPAQSTPSSKAELEQKVRESLEKAIDFYKKKLLIELDYHSNFWAFAALWGAHVDLKQDIKWGDSGRSSPWHIDSRWQKGITGELNVKEYAGWIIGSLILEQNPRKFGKSYPQDLTKGLKNLQQANGVFKSDDFGHIFAMLALDLAGADYQREKALQHLLSRQGADGYFGGLDQTGWTLFTLASYQDRPQVQAAIEKAVAGLNRHLREDGEFSKGFPAEGDNANSLAAIISGLAAVGEDLLSEKWTRNGNNLVEVFIDRYQLADGSFTWLKRDPRPNGMTTEQAVIALGDVLARESVFQRIKQYREDVLDKTASVQLHIEGSKGTLLAEQGVRVSAIGSKPTVRDVLEIGLQEAEIDYKIVGSGQKATLESIAGESRQAFQGLDKWFFIVNGERISTDMAEYEIEDDDQIYVYYGNVGDLYQGHPHADDLEKLTLFPKVTLHPSQPKAGEELQIEIAATLDTYDYYLRKISADLETGIAQATVTFNGKPYRTDEQGLVIIPATEIREGTFKLTVSKDVQGSYPRLVRWQQFITIDKKNAGDSGGGAPLPDKKGTITLSVAGPVGEGYLLYPRSLELVEDDTAFTVLHRALPGEVEYTGSAENLYVKGIKGLREFDRGPGSGWVYEVNGEYPIYSAGIYYLRDGDQVAWRYTKDLGKDIGAEAAGGAGAGDSGSLPPEYAALENQMQKLGFSAENQKPVQEIGQTVIITNKEKKMSKEAAEKLLDKLRKYSFSLQETISAALGGSLVDQEEEVKLFVPAAALERPLELSIQKISVGGSSPEDVFVLSGVYEFGPSGTRFAKPVFIAIKTPLLLEDLEDLALAWWNEQTKQWIPIPAVVDAQSGVVTGMVTHFTKFAVIDTSKLPGMVKQKKPAAWETALERALDLLKRKEELTEWEALGLARAGEQVPATYLHAVEAFLKEQKGEFRKITDYERIVLALTAIGQDPHKVAGYNLLEKIYNHANMTMQGTNGAAFALLALDSKAYPVAEDALWTREKLVQWLLAQQNEDGGFSLSKASGGESDVDITAMVLQSLAVYQKRSDVKEAIERALIWLSEQQLEGGGFSNMDGQENSESVAQVLIALTSLGLDPLETRFVQKQGDLLSNLLTFVEADGGFAHVHGQGSNSMATEQAVLALVAYKPRKYPLSPAK